jgi:hypothetical protein
MTDFMSEWHILESYGPTAPATQAGGGFGGVANLTGPDVMRSCVFSKVRRLFVMVGTLLQLELLLA